MGYFIVCVIAASVLLALAFYAYGPRDAAGVKRSLAVTGSGLLKTYNHIRHTADRVAERGWRRAFGWLGVLVAYFTFIYAPANGIAVDTGAVNAFLTMITGTFVMRGVEQINRIRTTGSPTGGLVNDSALA